MGKPLVQHQLEASYSHGIRRCTIIAADNLTRIRDYCADGSRFGISLRLVSAAASGQETDSLLKHRSLLEEDCVIVAGRTLAILPLAELSERHAHSGRPISVIRHAATRELVALMTSPPRTLEMLEVYHGSLETTARRLLEEHRDAGILDASFSYQSCRSIADVLALTGALLEKPGEFITETHYQQLQPGIYLGHHVSVSPRAILRPPLDIGDFCHIMDGAEIGPRASIAAGSIVAKGAVVRDAVIAPNSYVGELTRVKQAIVVGPTLVHPLTKGKVVISDPVLLDRVRQRTIVDLSHSLMQRTAALGLLAALAPVGVGLGVLSKLRHGQAIKGISTMGRGEVSDSDDVRFLPRFVRLELADEGLPLRWYPTLVNIAKGQMRFVGPRPIPEEQSEELGIAASPARWATHPGLVPVGGLFETDSTEAAFAEALYASKHGLLQDVRCAAAHFAASIIGKRNARRLSGL